MSNVVDAWVIARAKKEVVGYPCRVCGAPIAESDFSTAVYAGYSACGRARSAHKGCWDSNTSKSAWAYPDDAS